LTLIPQYSNKTLEEIRDKLSPLGEETIEQLKRRFPGLSLKELRDIKRIYAILIDETLDKFVDKTLKEILEKLKSETQKFKNV
jgi:hypothetical protein